MTSMSTDSRTEPCPFPVGTRVKVTRPEIPTSKRKGQIGRVVKVNSEVSRKANDTVIIPGTDFHLCIVQFEEPLIVGGKSYGNPAGYYSSKCLDQYPEDRD